MGTVTDFVFLGSKITVDSAYSHEIKKNKIKNPHAYSKLI